MLKIHVATLTDNGLVAEGLSRIISAEPSFVACGPRSPGGAAGRDLGPDVLLVDSRMAGVLGLVAELMHDDPGLRLILFGAEEDDDRWAKRALEAGARGILARSASAEHLIKAIRVVHDGQIWARRGLFVPNRPPSTGTAGQEQMEKRLSVRERTVLRHVANGLGNKEIADRMGITQATVKAHLTRIFQKLNLRGRGELAAAYHGVPIRLDPGRTASAR